MKTTTYVMTIIGRDKPGLVELISNLISTRGGNWLESRMARMAGQFAGILRIQVPEGQSGALLHALRNLEEEGLRTVIHSTTETECPSRKDLIYLHLLGNDRPGIIREISQAIAGRGVNVEALTSECVVAPISAERLFKAEAVLRVPEEVSVEDLRTDLEAIAADLMVDISLHKPEPE